MNINFVGKNIEITDALKSVTMDKFSKLDKYFEKDVNGTATFSKEGNREIIEVTIEVPGSIIRVEEHSEDMYASIDLAIDVLERQVRKYKDKLQDQKRGRESIRFDNIKSLKEEDQDEKKIVRRKAFGMKPMMEEEAILQMELLRHNFFVFLDAESNQVNVLYKRKDGNYGMIETQV